MKIGICDSGLGGLTVLEAIRKDFPNVDIDYLADNIRLPYGEKSKAVLVDATTRMIDSLLLRGSQLVIVACNSASSQLSEVFEKRPDLRNKVLGVVEPMADFVASNISSQNICIVGTRATIRSGVYAKFIKQKLELANIFEVETPLLVPLIEEGYFDNDFIYEVLDNYLGDIKNNFDICILGCTHYPLIRDKFEKYLGKEINVLSSGDALVPFLRSDGKITNEGSGNLELFLTDERLWFVDEAKFLFPKLLASRSWTLASI